MTTTTILIENRTTEKIYILGYPLESGDSHEFPLVDNNPLYIFSDNGWGYIDSDGNIGDSHLLWISRRGRNHFKISPKYS